MAEPKNIFNFGTGNIDKDQWLRDIDSEQEDFISKYGMATNKHRTALLRQAFQDLRTRIVNGDMLNRTADGRYQFGSMLNRDDKHMQEAYERALGFMGGLARRQIQAPPPAEPEKKALGDLEERYIKSLNPSGKFNTEAYWKNQTDEERRTTLKNFLNKELKEAGNYQDFGAFGDKDTYTQRLQNVMTLLESGKANDWSLQQLGFTKNWLTQPTDQQETEAPKSELEQANERLQAATEAQQVQQINQQIAALTTPSPTYQALLTFNPSDYWSYDSFVRDRNKRIEALKYTDKNGNEFLKANSILGSTPTGNGHFENRITTRNTAWNGQAAKDARTYAQSQYAQEVSSRLNNYFKNLGVNYQSVLNNDRKGLMTNLAQLFTQGPDNNYIMNDVINNLFVKQQDGKFGLRGSTLSYDPSMHTLYNGNNIDAYKEGGILKGQNGLIVDDSYYVKPTNNIKKAEETPKQENSEEMDAGDWVTILGTTAADIGSMLSANAVGAGTAVSAGLGVASTLGNSVNDFRHGNVGSGLANLGIGLTTDLIGLVPGLGAGAKGYKIGRTLTRFARPLMAAFTANNFKEAGEVLGKGVKNGFGSLTAQDWTVLSTALTSMISRGKSAHTRQKNVEFMSKASQHSSPTDAKGNVTRHIINEEGFVKARKELLEQKKFGYNTSSRKYTNKMWVSIPEGGEILTPFYAKPFEWPKFGFGKNKKQKQVEGFEDYLKLKREHEASLQNNGSDASTIVLNEDELQPMMRSGGILKALRNGGILKADAGLQFPDQKPEQNFNSQYYQNWVNLNWNNPENFQATLKGYKPGGSSYRISNGLPAKGGEPKKRYENAQGEQDFMSAYQEQQAYYDKDAGSHIFGDVLNYYNQYWLPSNQGRTYEDFIKDYNSNVDRLRSDASKKLTGVANQDKTWGEYNTLFNQMYANYSPFSEKLKDTLGESTWRRTPNTFNGINDRENLRYGLLNSKDPKSKVILDNEGHLVIPDLQLDSEGNNPEDKTQAKKGGNDSASERKTTITSDYKNPFDPSLLISTAKYFAGLRGNRDIYQNLLDEMPEAPLRDPLDRKLAIVGWQERIKNGQNQLADLRRIQQMQQGSDQQTNFATALETERTGRDIMDKDFAEDSGRQFETAQKSWNLDNEDVLYNTGVGDANRKSIADRQRMMAQIRAARRSGDQNLKMGLLADAGNWFMKRYQREQDMIDKARELSLGTPEEWAQAEYTSRLGELANKKASDLTEAEKAKIQAIKAQVMREMRQNYSERYYNLYHTPGFGGGIGYTLMSKNGSKLEVAKLKARSKDNDRYVSMIKDLRKRRRR